MMLRNPSASPRWLLVPQDIADELLVGAQAYALDGYGRPSWPHFVHVYVPSTATSFSAFKLPARGTLKLRGLELTTASDSEWLRLPESIVVRVFVARSLHIGGRAVSPPIDELER